MSTKTAGHDLKLAALLPPLFICCVIGVVWSVYMCLHLLPMLQVGIPSELKDLDKAKRGMTQMIIAQVLFSFFLTCYTRAILTSPGSIPDSDEWRYTRMEGSNRPLTQEVKETGERRRCKWCLKYKPDRCHHCRVCKTCVLRMDHHCPWIMNCVGWGNHKFFLLTVFYAAVSCTYICLTVFESVVASTHQDMPHTNRFLLVLCNVLSGFFSFLMTGFLGFHLYLTLNALTTIEFCEKAAVPKPGPNTKAPCYNLGAYGNLATVLGPRPLLWLLPIDPARGDGVNFGQKSTSGELADADPEWTSAATQGSLAAALR